MPNTVHVFPVNDLVEHDCDSFDKCVCGPHVEFIDGGGRTVTHHSLDGREHTEPDHDRVNCPAPECSSFRKPKPWRRARP